MASRGERSSSPRDLSHRVAVLLQAALVEPAQTSDLFARPRHEHSGQPVAAALPQVCAILDDRRLPQEHLDAVP